MAVRQTVEVLQGDDDVTIFNVTETVDGVTAVKDLAGWEVELLVREDRTATTPLFTYDTEDVSPRIVVTDEDAGEVTVRWDPEDIAAPAQHWHRLRIRHDPEATAGRTVSYGLLHIIDT